MLAKGLESVQASQTKADDLAVQVANGTLQDPAQYTMAATEAALGAAAHHGHPQQGRGGLPGDHEDAGLT